MSRFARWTGVVLAGVVASCGGGQAHPARFSTDWTDDGGASIGHVWDRVGGSTIAPSADVAVGVAGHTDKLIGLPLGSGGAKWTFAHPLDARPIVTGDVVVASGGGEAFALNAKSGSVIWRRPTGGVPLIGAGDGGTVSVLTFRKSGGTGSTLLAIAHDGSVVQQIETDRPLGMPSVLGRLAFVPWAGQYVSVVDLSTGDEVARVTLREQTTRAWTQAGSLWFGQAGYIRFDARIRDASRGKATSLTLPMRELPGTPKLMPPGDPLGPVAGAEDKVHLYARPTSAGDAAAFDSGRWYATYFRLAMGFGTDKGKLAWVHSHPTNFLGGAASSGGVVLCDEQGKITTLDAKTGSVLSEADLGEQVESCTVSIDGLAASGNPADVKPLAQQLADAVTADDPQLVVAQKLLLRELASVEDDTATKTLVDLASDPRTSPDLLGGARTALANRRNGASYMEAALAKHYDFLKDVLRAPPVGPMAQALGAMKEKAAAPLLAAHLLDTADTDDDVKQAAAALAVVAGPDQLTALRQFFGMYRASAENDDIASAVVSVGQALLTLNEAARVADAAKDDTTVSYAKERLQALLAAQPPAAANPAPAADPNEKKK
jgi:outer membrane protein assembly factor BamB